MASIHSKPETRFAAAAQRFCEWAVSEPSTTNELPRLAELLSELIAAGCALGWEEGMPSDRDLDEAAIAAVRKKAAALPLQYYSEVFNNLIVPPEEPVVGNLCEDVEDIYSDIAPGLEAYRAGDVEEALAHWRYWFVIHWGEHATSAMRAVWSYLAKRRGSREESDN